MKDTPLRSPEQLGALIRLNRRSKGLSQAAFADQLGVERKWVLRLEAGNPKAEFGLVLKALAALGVQAFLRDSNQAEQRSRQSTAVTSRIDEVFRRLDRPARK